VKTPDVSVVIPTLNRREELRRTLGSLLGQTIPADEYEIVVVVDGSTDGTVEMLADLQATRPIVAHVQSRHGRAAAVNAGVRRARGEFLVFLDDDITASPELLEYHRAYLRAHPGHAVVGAAPVAVTPDSPHVVQLVGNKMNAHLARIGAPGFEFKERDVYSGNFGIARALFLDIGGFDEDFTLYGNEDCELARRLLLRGVPIVYHAGALGHQRYTKTFAQLVCDTYEKGRTRVLLSKKHPALASSLGVMTDAPLSRKARVFLALARQAARNGARHAAPPLTGVIARLDQRWPARLAPRYRAILDLYFWLGVSDERRRAGAA
jgi:glycosyltransferase involved in cell wall biosynthesis